MRLAVPIVLGLVWLSACGSGTVSTHLPLPPTESDATLVERVVDRTSGARPDLRRLEVYVASDGSRIACGEWTAPDGIGTTEWAPFYIRWRGDKVMRVHLDDATGFGLAELGCNQAEAGTLRISG